MFVEWRPIETFDNYSVSDSGSVRNDRFGREMKLLTNQSGNSYVGLWRNNKAYNRGVAQLVAQAFMDLDPQGIFNTPINLNGDRFDNSLYNLALRPRWFALKYTQQFQIEQPTDYFPIEEEITQQRFHNPWQAATTFGLIRIDILIAIRNRLEVWPTRQRFRLASFTR
jgi:hypothetical protein